MTIKCAGWIPAVLSEQRAVLAAREKEDPQLAQRLLSDARLADFWRWYEKKALPETLDKKKKSLLAKEDDFEKIVASAFFTGLILAFKAPEKIESMTKTERNDYFNDVRGAATTLLGLLKGTSFDLGLWDGAWPLSDNHLCRILTHDMHAHLARPERWSSKRTIHYEEEGVAWTLAPEYPYNSITDLLETIVKWTHDSSVLGPMFDTQYSFKQRGVRGLKTYTLMRLAEKYCIDPDRDFTMPHEHLANLVNAGLDLADGDELNAGAVRKAVTRAFGGKTRT